MNEPPRAIYRLQFNSHFGFGKAKEIVPYLVMLGISDLYASPIFKAKRGSIHGYDVVDPNLLNPELGTEEEFEALLREVKAHKMGWVQDVVPNHMSYGYENTILSDVLEKGSQSEYFQFFDVKWDHPDEGLKGRILAPFLGDLYSQALEKGEIKLVYGEPGFAIIYYDIRFPLRLKSYVTVLNMRLKNLEQRLGEQDPDIVALKSIISEAGGENPGLGLKKRLWDLYSRSSEVHNFLDSKLKAFNGKIEDTLSFDLLDELLSEQLFRLSFWKVASDEINYRRFFIMNDLISLNTERDSVFEHIHSYLFDLMEKKKITGLRIDHIDGLYDPEEYLRKIRERLGDGYLVVEKILLPGEGLPASWPVQGTTGYDFLNYLNGIFCDISKKDEFERIYFRFTGANISFKEIAYEKKKLMAERHMSGDVDNLARFLKNIFAEDRYGSDVTLSGIRKALIELLVSFPIYRTYVCPRSFSERDRSILKEAARKAKERNLDLFNELDFVEHFLLAPKQDRLDSWLNFIMKFQQFTSPLMAKGIEDTALYNYYCLLSLNEVGGDPGSFGVSLDEFHHFNEDRTKNWPYSMNSTATHDTKRGEDARARINVLSEIPEEWSKHIDAWIRMNEGLKKKVKGRDVPDRNDEYFLYQTLIGAYSLLPEELAMFRERAKNYVIKAVREAKVHSGWVKHDASYEVAFASFLEAILDSEEFLKDFSSFQRKVAHHGMLNSLAQTLVKMTAPGIPDFYQGTELWDLNFVDPDNRQPVDFEKRRRYLDEIMSREETTIEDLMEELLATKEDGRAKLFLIHRTLKARKENATLFAEGEYIRLGIEGRFQENVIAFARRREDAWALTIAPRLTALPGEDEALSKGYPESFAWSDAQIIIPKGAPVSWRSAITNQMIVGEKTMSLRSALSHFPVALLLGKVEK